MSTTTDIASDIVAQCKAAVGRRREVEDSLAPEAAAKVAVLLGQDELDTYLPPTFHWAYFNKGIATAHMGHDMHERLGAFLPAAPFNRRMWAAGAIALHKPLRLGQPARRRSTVAAVEFKRGKSGQMCFVTVAHDIEQDGVSCITETQTIVYRDRGAPERALRKASDPVPDGYFVHPDHQLFFYSAVTHNGHRIHWDLDFCRNTEGYPDLVAHGPLMATELCEAMRGGARGPVEFEYRALAPVFATTPVRIVAESNGEERSARMERSDGVVSMSATMRIL